MFSKSDKSNGKQSRGISKIVVAVVLLFVAVSAINLIGVALRAAEKRSEIEQLSMQIEQQQQGIDEVNYLLQDGNELEYIERIAREKYGYAAPGERAFYVSDGG